MSANETSGPIRFNARLEKPPLVTWVAIMPFPEGPVLSIKRTPLSIKRTPSGVSFQLAEFNESEILARWKLTSHIRTPRTKTGLFVALNV
jgi:hypothetical protein